MPEFGAVGPGTSLNDPEVDDMYSAYLPERHAYFVLVSDGHVVGGSGIAPLLGGDPDTCELRKMYVLPSTRGHGQGRRLLHHCIERARALGFEKCYLETLATMDSARRLYERAGFRAIRQALGNTGHSKCDRYMLLDIPQ